VPVINAGTHFAQNLENRLTQVKFGAGSREGGPELRAELSEDIIGDGQTLKCLYILLCRPQPLKVTISPW